MYLPCAHRHSWISYASFLRNREQLCPCILIQHAVQTFEEEVCVGVLCEVVDQLCYF